MQKHQRQRWNHVLFILKIRKKTPITVSLWSVTCLFSCALWCWDMSIASGGQCLSSQVPREDYTPSSPCTGFRRKLSNTHLYLPPLTWLRDTHLAASGPRILPQLGWAPFLQASPLGKATRLGLRSGAGKQSFWVVTSLPEVRIHFIGFQRRLHVRVAWGAFKSYHCLSPAQPF